MKRLAAITALALLVAVPTPADAAPRDAVAGLVNAERRAHGIAPLSGSPALRRSAGRYARSLLRRGVFRHGPRISAPSRFTLLGENLALLLDSQPQPRRVVRMWMTSAGHRGVMLNPRLRRLGVGRASGRLRGRPATIWVLHVGRA